MTKDFRFPLLLVCFFVSGFAALIYQTAWTTQFSYVFGTSELAVATVLAGYMGGLALGAAVATFRRPTPRQRPIFGHIEEPARAIDEWMIRRSTRERERRRG